MKTSYSREPFMCGTEPSDQGILDPRHVSVLTTIQRWHARKIILT